MNIIDFIGFFAIFWGIGCIISLLVWLVFWYIEFGDDIRMGIHPPKTFISVTACACICSWITVIVFTSMIVCIAEDKLQEKWIELDNKRRLKKLNKKILR